MTGFARSEGAFGEFSWNWEIRTVNGRGLDVRLRMPQGNEALEQPGRMLISGQLSRGNVTANLFVSREGNPVQIRLNEEVLKEVTDIISRTKNLVEATPPSLDGILGIKGVLEAVEPEEDADEFEERKDRILESLDIAIKNLITARQDEGKKLAQVIEAQISGIKKIVSEIEALPERSPEAIREKLVEQISRLLESSENLDEQRLHQEAMILATKSDIAEELDRLNAHIESGYQLLQDKAPVGRKLEFLVQELNREANTICS
ncbi:MAG: YicC/YloC family endoribonuclease, partial [Methyloligellaceae bacterium]